MGFRTRGIEEEIRKFSDAGKKVSAATQAAVKAGGEALAKRLREAAPVYQGSRKDVKPGALRDSIKVSEPQYTAEKGHFVKVGPVGKHHGQDLAMIGNVLEYGRSGGKSHRPWFHDTVAAAEEEVNAAMKQAFDEAMK